MGIRNQSFAGSPPLARGIHALKRNAYTVIGITPACAGNTDWRRMNCQILWDHPRLRGEYNTIRRGDILFWGSPPLARGIHSRKSRRFYISRITPACAGNTAGFLLSILLLKDHPRLRGEYPPNPTDASGSSGSPPLARGIQRKSDGEPFIAGITPACAGNTESAQGGRRYYWDHPRLRGEYTKKIPYLQPFPNLHI